MREQDNRGWGWARQIDPHHKDLSDGYRFPIQANCQSQLVWEADSRDIWGRYRPIVAIGKTIPIRPFVSTFRAQTSARPQQENRDGASPSKVRRKKSRLKSSQRLTRTSGIKKRVNMSVPKAKPDASAAWDPAFSPKTRRPEKQAAHSKASTPRASGSRPDQS